MRLQRWQCQSNYMGEDFSDYFVVLSKIRDSVALERSNFEVALKRLEAVQPQDDDLIAPRFTHWAVGWVEMIMVHSSSEALVAEAEDIVSGLDLYPVLDEDHWSQLQYDEAESWWEHAPVSEREWVLSEYGEEGDSEGGIPYAFVATF